jgi:hypothetical protein
MVSCLEDTPSMAKASRQELQGKGFALGPDGGAAALNQKGSARLAQDAKPRRALRRRTRAGLRAGGTRLRLKLPRCVPDSDAAAG